MDGHTLAIYGGFWGIGYNTINITKSLIINGEYNSSSGGMAVVIIANSQVTILVREERVFNQTHIATPRI